MRCMDTYKIWLCPQRDSQLRNVPLSALSNRLSITGGGQ
ncbi:hypothetical protein J2Y56_003253 [Pseudomonas sp. BE134]|jgi:hypothetical protein|nr:hypothetical protein [Pseudomonas sp. BE134]